MEQILFWEYQNGPIHLVGWHVYYLLALFSLLAWWLGRFFFRPVLEVVEKRQGRILEAERAAAEARRQAEESRESTRQGLLEARQEAFRLREQAQQEAAAKAETQLAAAREKAAAWLEETSAQLQAQAADARGSLKNEAESMARSIADRVLGRGGAGA